ncbi:MAG TPA: glycosyltransferase family 2 protein [Candidatus Omnitrophota bacterium]|nr:glycosyltransferase family 2 protein [Candidatus Omnitrophota bacterium]HPT06849.1 glycosyltransferase family 2 protein [Candidatus Omnitrophota bacterium]
MQQPFELTRRVFEIIPAFISWSIILVFILFAFLLPMPCAFFIIIFDIFWVIRGIYLTSLLIMAHRRLQKEKNRLWFQECKEEFNGRWEGIYQAVILPVYKEDLGVLIPSLESLHKANYPKDRMIVVVAFEERAENSYMHAQALEARYKNEFYAFIPTFHPDGLPGETRTKGANATWAAQRLKEFLQSKGIAFEGVLVSCFDADTCVEKEYFGCLLKQFLISDKPLQRSYQPIPVYNNNIWKAPSLARIIEITSSYCQLIDSMRLEKFVTFSSHSMSFKTLVDIDYWPVDRVSDDSLIYWKAYLYYNGDYKVIPLYITVSMDVACDKNLFKTFTMQYRQKRRWAWGVEVFPYVMMRFRRDSIRIPFREKARRVFQILDSHVTWAVWAVIITVVSPISVFMSVNMFKESVIAFNLPRITSLLFQVTNVTILLWVILSFSLLPPRPKDIPWFARLRIITQWLFIPFVVFLVGSTPALDAQTRLAFGRYMGFAYTEKKHE